MEHFPYGKQIGKFLDQQNKQKRPQAHKPIFLGLDSEKYENVIPLLKNWKFLEVAHEISVHNGSYAFPNELMRFQIEAKPIWKKNQKHC